jgi:hypothetical protein
MCACVSLFCGLRLLLLRLLLLRLLLLLLLLGAATRVKGAISFHWIAA